MKKVLSVLLVLLMIFSLATFVGCTTEDTDKGGDTTTTPPATEGGDTATTPPATEGGDTVATPPAPEGETEEEKMARLEASKANEFLPEKLEAGMEVMVAFLPPEMGATTMVDLDNGFRASFEDIGCTYMSAAFNIDPAQQITAIENYVTMGVAEVITIVFDPGLADTCAKAIEAGTYIACWGGVPAFDGFSLATGRDFAAIGKLIGDMMVAWAETQEGVIKTAALTNSSNPTYVMQTDALLETLNASDKVDLVYHTEVLEMDVNSGFNFAQEALTYDPGIRMFLGYNAGQALGMNNYIVSIEGVDLAGYGVFSADMDSTVDALLADGTNGVSCFRGYASCGLEKQHEYIFQLSVKLFNGEIDGGTYLEPLWVKTNFGFEYDER